MLLCSLPTKSQSLFGKNVYKCATICQLLALFMLMHNCGVKCQQPTGWHNQSHSRQWWYWRRSLSCAASRSLSWSPQISWLHNTSPTSLMYSGSRREYKCLSFLKMEMDYIYIFRCNYVETVLSTCWELFAIREVKYTRELRESPWIRCAAIVPAHCNKWNNFVDESLLAWK